MKVWPPQLDKSLDPPFTLHGWREEEARLEDCFVARYGLDLSDEPDIIVWTWRNGAGGRWSGVLGLKEEVDGVAVEG